MTEAYTQNILKPHTETTSVYKPLAKNKSAKVPELIILFFYVLFAYAVFA